MSKKVTYIKTSSLHQKFAQIILALVLLIVALNIWAGVNHQGQTLLEENSFVLADNILLQTANSASFYIENDDMASLEQLTKSALQSEYILEMLIYDKQGKVLSQSENATSAKARFFETQSDELTKLEPVPFVREVKNDNNELLGYVRLTLLKKSLQADSKAFIRAMTKQFLLVALLAGVVGYLLTTGFRSFSKNSFVIRT